MPSALLVPFNVVLTVYALFWFGYRLCHDLTSSGHVALILTLVGTIAPAVAEAAVKAGLFPAVGVGPVRTRADDPPA